MAIEAEKLLAIFEAKFDSLEKSLDRAQKKSRDAFKGIEGDGKRAEDSLSRIGRRGMPGLDGLNSKMRQTRAETDRLAVSMGGLAKSFGVGFFGGIAGGVSLQAAQQLVDSATRIRNALKVAGLEGSNLKEVYDALFASAQKNAAPIESLTTLYSRLSLAQKSLGVSQQDLLKFTDRVSLALRVSGTDAQSASGALLQLSQALGGGVVRAEEFNSVLEGAPAIIQAVAAGLTEAGGSVSTLRGLVNDGKVSSEAFFRAFLAGATTLEDKVAGSALTVSQAFVQMQNVLIDTAGRIDNVTGASASVGEGLQRLAGIIQGLGQVFEKTANGPIGTFLGKLQKINDLIGKLDPLSQGLNAITGENLNAAANLLGGGPQLSDIAAKEQELERLKQGLQKTYDAGVQARIKDLELEIIGLKNIPKANQYPLRSDADVAASAGAVTQLDPVKISIGDYPVSGVAGKQTAAEQGKVLGGEMAVAFIKRFEGFRSKAYWDVDAYRVGYGSDTTTGAGGGVSRVGANTTTSLEAANRDLARRIGEFQAVMTRQLGADTMARFSEEQLAALTSITYNYGELPDRIVNAIRSGGDVGGAIRGLAGDNGGINASRRKQEADLYTSNQMPAALENVNQLTDAWENMRSVTAQTSAQTMQLQDQYSVLGQVGLTALQGLANAMADGKITGEELFGILVDIVQQLLSMPTGAFGGSGGGGFLGQLFGGLFGGGSSFPAGPGNLLWAEGGYTGRGNKNDIAGAVHRGEYVFSKRAVERIGIGALESLHRRGKGYADGGWVGREFAAPPDLTMKMGNGKTLAENRGITLATTYQIDARGSNITESQFRMILRENNEVMMKQVKRNLPAMMHDNHMRALG